MSKTKPTVPEVLRQYKAAQKFETDTEFANALAVDKQRLSQWLNGIHEPTVDYLRVTAMLWIIVEPWKAHLAVDLLKAMGQAEEIPCTCMEYVPDNQYCPKHHELYEERRKAEEVVS